MYQRFLLASLAFLAFVSLSGAAFAQAMTRESVSSSGAQATGGASTQPSITPDGRFIVFSSAATSLVSGDSNGRQDIFLRDRQSATTVRLNLGPRGVQATGNSQDPVISADGNFVAFLSYAENLVPNDNNAAPDIFLADVQTGNVTRVSLDSNGAQGNGYCRYAAISADGRFVAFSSDSTGLVPLDNNNLADVFVRDVTLQTTTRLSVDSFGTESNGSSGQYGLVLSADGMFVVFSSDATNLAPGTSGPPVTNIYMHSITGGSTALVSADASGTSGNAYSRFPAVSADGRFVAFMSAASNLAPFDTNGREDVFVRDMQTSLLLRVSVDSSGLEGNGNSSRPSISPDGRFVAFESTATNLVPGDTNGASDVFVRDLATGTTTLASVNSNTGGPGNGPSNRPSIATYGRHMAFDSAASDLVSGDSNVLTDIFGFDPRIVTLTSISPNLGSESGGETVHLTGIDFTSVPDTTVRFGGNAATVLEVTSTRITVHTPAGTGTVEVQVVNSNGLGTLPSAYTYVAPNLAARYGNVNLLLGDREDVLLVNASPGDTVNREVLLSVRQAIGILMSPPSNLSSARFVLYGWVGAASPAGLTRIPRGLGFMVDPTPFTGGTPQPAVIWNNAGYRQTLGTPTLPSSPAPSTVLNRPRGARSPVVVTFQGLIQDNGSLIAERWSITNAVILRIQ